MGELTTASYPGLPLGWSSYPELSWKEFAQGRVRAECCKLAYAVLNGSSPGALHLMLIARLCLIACFPCLSSKVSLEKQNSAPLVSSQDNPTAIETLQTYVNNATSRLGLLQDTHTGVSSRVGLCRWSATVRGPHRPQNRW